MRVISRHIDMSESIPTKVSDMKEGECRLVEDGFLCRIGNQILLKSLGTYLVTILESWILGESVQSTEQTDWSYGESVFIDAF